MADVARYPGDPPSPWEGEFGYSRILAAGPFALIGGTTSLDPCGFVMGESPYEQAAEIYHKLGHELGRLGLGYHHVVQVRVYVTDISRAAEVGRAHSEVFADVRPLMTMVEVSALIDPRMMVEIEAVAIVEGD
jgi:enamine deaminase RidA (YjgF/YER057c/UK114 family)